jgi:hypothetical protein
MRYSCSTPGHPLSLTTGSRKHPLDQLPNVLSKMTGCGSRYDRFRQTVTRDGCRWCRVRTQVRTGAESAVVNSASFGANPPLFRMRLGLQPACQVISEEPRSFQSGLCSLRPSYLSMRGETARLAKLTVRRYLSFIRAPDTG